MAEPKWQQVLTDIERRLATGEISDRFPTDRELVDHYEVSRHTVREAVRHLRARGIVERHRGRGSFVRDDQMHQPVSTLYSLFQEVERRGHTQRSEILTFERCAHPDTARELGLALDAELVTLARLRFADDVALAFDTVWMPADVGVPLLGADMTRTSLYDELAARTGLRVDASEETIEPIVPDADTQALLTTDPGEALFRVERRGFVAGRMIEWRVTLVRGRRFAFVSTWRADRDDATPRFSER